jgi:hypothetical protein
MSTAYIVVTLLGAVLAAFSAGSLFFHAKWVVQPLTHYGVPRSWWPRLATAKAAGAAGLLVGLFVPVIGVMAGIGLVLYFAGPSSPWSGRAGSHTSRTHCCTWRQWSLPWRCGSPPKHPAPQGSESASGRTANRADTAPPTREETDERPSGHR